MPDLYVFPPAGHLFGRREMRLNPVHIVKAEPRQHDAVCSVYVFNPDLGSVIAEGARFCPRCLRALSLKDRDLERGHGPWR